MPAIGDRVREVAEWVRSAISALDRSPLPVTWANFPHGSCDAATYVLAHFIQERLGIVSTRAAGWLPHGRSKSHAWLEVDGLIVDITADQFGLPPVIVAAASEWHSQLVEVSRRPWSVGAHEWGREVNPVIDALLRSG